MSPFKLDCCFKKHIPIVLIDICLGNRMIIFLQITIAFILHV